VQANHLLPPLKQAAPADGHAADGSAAVEVGVDEDQLARYVGFFLRTCPGLSKVTIGELLGDPDKFFLKVGWGGCAHEDVLSALRVCLGGACWGLSKVTIGESAMVGSHWGSLTSPCWRWVGVSMLVMWLLV
jgi:hypothetical protein